ncbi:hypothetical protein ACEWBS_22260 [Vibrio parahaemolyticus]
MDIQYIWPLVGVFLGWLLNAISNSRKARLEERKTIAALLTQLISVQSKLDVYNSIVYYMKQRISDMKRLEEYRYKHAQRTFSKSTDELEELKVAIKNYSLLFPLSATALEETYGSLMVVQNTSLEAGSSNEERYQKMLKVLDYKARTSAESLQYHIFEVSLKHGVVTYLKVRYTDFRKYKRKATDENINSLNEAFSGVDGLLQELEVSHNKAFKSDS